MSAIDLGWYTPRKGRVQRPRWALAVNAGRVLYGTGGIKHHECLQRTFKRWITRTDATRKTQS